ncbi:MBL fold metallo-hydrolase [Candidatus Solirubrobacter pratensis]|uniref:MBL fold metallo-hydrolase n=1 Tax=Candidatus Solirubrobacter pratensis TaxID=1298857 RepID=UPI0003F9F374|nr:MBL fold metallo-hydrolase [Candidatus Solirubrobacter pratensis]
MRITVLGKSPAFQDAGGACSGYLVEGGGVRLLLDCGPGVFAKLRQVTSYVDVDAVLLSHLHADHVMDLVTFASALRYGPHEAAAPRLLAPPGARDVLASLCAGGSMRPDHIDGAFELSVYDPEDVVELGGLRARFRPVPHFIPCNAVELAEDAARLTFSADCGPNDALVEFAADTDLLLSEATLIEPEEGHLTPAQAGELAARAGARRLVLTHFSDEADAAWVRAEGERGFGAPVELAADGAVYEIGRA